MVGYFHTIHATIAPVEMSYHISGFLDMGY